MKFLEKIEYKLVREEVSEHSTKQIKGADDVFEWFKFLSDAEKEKFIVVCLNSKAKIVCFDMVGIGTVNQCPVYPREIVKAAILSNSPSIILIHNHPSADPTPSQADSQLTRDVKAACKLLGIQVLDHIIIGFNGYYSFAAKGIL